jgi:hypothetical protein
VEPSELPRQVATRRIPSAVRSQRRRTFSQLPRRLATRRSPIGWARPTLRSLQHAFTLSGGQSGPALAPLLPAVSPRILYRAVRPSWSWSVLAIRIGGVVQTRRATVAHQANRNTPSRRGTPSKQQRSEPAVARRAIRSAPGAVRRAGGGAPSNRRNFVHSVASTTRHKRRSFRYTTGSQENGSRGSE